MATPQLSSWERRFFDSSTKRHSIHVLTREEIAKHNTPGDAYIIVGNLAVDVTEYATNHPGGADCLQRHFGKDATERFIFVHGPFAFQAMEKHVVGVVADI